MGEPLDIVATGGVRNVLKEEAERHHAQMQGWWDQSITKNLNLPDWYQKVTVLMIKWRKDLDDLSVENEVRPSVKANSSMRP